MASVPWAGPRKSVEALADRYGRDVVTRGCCDLLAGRAVKPALVFGLGGPPARWAVHGGASGPDYWLRVWGLRGLLWLWDEEATSTVVDAMTDEAWRVREMAAKVVARNLVDPALAAVVSLQQDPVRRVRQAADRAVIRLTAKQG